MKKWPDQIRDSENHLDNIMDDGVPGLKQERWVQLKAVVIVQVGVYEELNSYGSKG